MNWDLESWANDPNRYGRAGLLYAGADTGTDPRQMGFTLNPEYIDEFVSNEEAGTSRSWNLKPEVQQRLGGMVQVPSPQYLKDTEASKVQWSDEFGWLTDPSNVKRRDSGFGGFLRNGGLMGLVTAGFLGPALFHSGILGGAAASGSQPHGMLAPGMESTALAESSLINSGGVPAWALEGAAPYGTNAVEAAEWFGGPGAATNPSPGLFGSSASTGLMGSLGQGINGLLGSALKNPLQALGLLQMAGGLLGRGNDGASNGGPSGDSGTFNLPKGNRGEWTPNPFTQRQIQNFRYGGG